MTTTDLDIALDMTEEEHIETASLFLDQSHRELLVGDTLQGCEKLWGAAAHATIAFCLKRGWACHDHRAMKLAIRQETYESGDTTLRAGFGIAEKFHANFYHGFMQQYELEEDPQVVYEFVDKIVSMVRSSSQS